jgi:hypothetical protein
MSDDMKYRVNNPNVTSEEIDGEIIIVNLLNGNYYSAVDLAAHLWRRIERGDNVGSIRDELLVRFADQRDSIEVDLSEFLLKLESEALIVKQSREESPNDPAPNGNSVDIGMPASYSVPVLSCYSDMQDLLLLDPIHDVADVGWPTAKPDTEN